MRRLIDPEVSPEVRSFSDLLRQAGFVVFVQGQKGGGAIKVQVTCSGYIAAGLGYREAEFELREGSTVQDLLERMKLPVSLSWVVVSIDGKIRDKRLVLNEGDQVLVLPLGGGG